MLYKLCWFNIQYGHQDVCLEICKMSTSLELFVIQAEIWGWALVQLVDFKVWGTQLFILIQVSDLWPIGPLVDKDSTTYLIVDK